MTDRAATLKILHKLDTRQGKTFAQSLGKNWRVALAVVLATPPPLTLLPALPPAQQNLPAVLLDAGQAGGLNSEQTYVTVEFHMYLELRMSIYCVASGRELPILCVHVYTYALTWVFTFKEIDLQF